MDTPVAREISHDERIRDKDLDERIRDKDLRAAALRRRRLDQRESAARAARLNTREAAAGAGGLANMTPTQEAEAARAAGLTPQEYQVLRAAGLNTTKSSWDAYQADQYSADTQDQTVNFSNVNTASGRDARTIIEDVLKNYGLQGLTNWAWGIITNGGGADEITDTIQDQPLFQAQFPGIIQREKLGLPPISMSDYISLEDSYDQLVTQYGLPRSVLTKDFVGNLIGQDVSVNELSDRITKGFAAVQAAPASVQQVFAQWFGPRGNAQLASYFLNPKNASDVLEKEAMMANVQGAGISAGVNIGQNRAAQIAQMGDTYSQVQQALNKVTTQAGLYQSNQAEGFANATVRGARGQANILTASNQGVNAALGLSAEDEQEVEQRELERQNAFKGGGGAAEQATQGYTGLGSTKAF